MLFAKIYNLNLDAFYGQISYYNNTLCIHKNYTAKFFAYISIMYTKGIMIFKNCNYVSILYDIKYKNVLLFTHTV